MSESERNGAEGEGNGASTYIDRKAVAAQKGIHEKTVADWENAGAFVEVISNGPLGKKRYLADAKGNVRMNPAWERKYTVRASDEMPASEATAQLELDDVRMVLRETVTAIASLPPVPNLAKEDLDAGMPVPVVIARVNGRARIASAVVIAVAFVLSVGLCVVAYLRRHGLWRPPLLPR